MSESTTTQALVDASSLPSEMLPLLAEMAKGDADSQYITLALPVDQDGTENNSEVSSQGPSTSKLKSESPEKKCKKDYKKSRKKRKKMELYVRECKKFVFIGKELKRWDQYRKELRVKTDEEFAKMLLDGFRKYTKVVQLVVGPTFGFPEVGSTDNSSLQPSEAPKDDSGSDELEDYINDVRNGLAEADAKNEAQDGETSNAVEVLLETGEEEAPADELSPEEGT